jgi:hypothetical protein
MVSVSGPIHADSDVERNEEAEQNDAKPVDVMSTNPGGGWRFHEFSSRYLLISLASQSINSCPARRANGFERKSRKGTMAKQKRSLIGRTLDWITDVLFFWW